MTENDDRRPAWTVLIARELAPKHRWHSQDTKESSCYSLLLYVLRPSVGSEIDARCARGICRGIEVRGMIADQLPRGVCLVALVCFFAVIAEMYDDFGQAAGLGIGKRTQQRGINHAENGGIGADAQSQRENDDRAEGWRAAEHPQGVADILQQLV